MAHRLSGAPLVSIPSIALFLVVIDLIIDATAGCEILCFLDAYSSYHQIKMAVKDQENMAFITPFGAFCYVSMPFGSRVLRRLISDVFRIVFIVRLGAMFMLMWMTLWSSQGRRTLSLMI